MHFPSTNLDVFSTTLFRDVSIIFPHFFMGVRQTSIVIYAHVAYRVEWPKQKTILSSKRFLTLSRHKDPHAFFIDVARGVFNDSFSRCIVYFHAFFHARTTKKYRHLCTRGLSDRMAQTKSNFILKTCFTLSRHNKPRAFSIDAAPGIFIDSGF